MKSTLLLTSSAIFSTSAALFAWYGICAFAQTVKILSHHLFWAQNSERNLCELLPHKWIWRTNIKQTSVIITAERFVRWSSCSIWAFPRTVNRPWPVRYASNILPSRNSYDTHHKKSHLKPLPGPSSDPSYKKPTISCVYWIVASLPAVIYCWERPQTQFWYNLWLFAKGMGLAIPISSKDSATSREVRTWHMLHQLLYLP
jgi:hypothetical protein